MQVVVVTGLSGSGKSTAIRALEDRGFYGIDNLPVTLIPRFLELSKNNQEHIGRVALGIDLRERIFLREYPAVLEGLRQRGHQLTILYFEASADVLVRRFSETRRPHPAAGDGGVLQGIRTEEEQLAGLCAAADLVMDTSAYNVHELREALLQHIERYPHSQQPLLITVESFGYKYGIPIDADIMRDVRFLPNPFFVDALRHKTGTERAVVKFVLGQEETVLFLSQLSALLQSTLPLYAREGKSYLTLAMGCTGGQHRSVVIAEELGRQLQARDYTVRIQHRDRQRQSASA